MNLKTNKKTIAILTILTLLISFVTPIVSNAVSQDILGKVAVSSASGKPGDEVTINITATEEITTTALSLSLKYDKTKFIYQKHTAMQLLGALIDSNNNESESKFTLGLAASDNVTIPKGTVISSITFKIADNATTDNLTLIYDTDEVQLATGKINVVVPATGISLDKPTLALDIANNNTGNLVATVTPENTTDTNIVWSSSNQAVAKVSGNGKNATVTAVAKGTAEISATINGHKATCNVAVSAAPLTSITLSEPPDRVLKGKEFKFKVTPNEGAELAEGALTWEASPADVATVDNDGTVHPLKAGEVTVTAKVTGQESITDSKTFTVEEIPLNSIAINTTDFELFLGDSKQLDILINPENTTDDVSKAKWESDSDAVTVDQDGVVKAVKIGEANIKAIVNEGQPNEKSATVKITVPEVKLEGIQIQSEKSQLKIGEPSDVWFDTTPERITDEIQEMKITSSDENIVSVNADDWTIKGVNPGKATISVYVKTADGREFTSSMEIEVLNEVYVPDEEQGKAAETTEEANKGPMLNTGDIAITTFVILMVASATGIAVIKFRKNNSKH